MKNTVHQLLQCIDWNTAHITVPFLELPGHLKKIAEINDLQSDPWISNPPLERVYQTLSHWEHALVFSIKAVRGLAWLFPSSTWKVKLHKLHFLSFFFLFFFFWWGVGLKEGDVPWKWCRQEALQEIRGHRVVGQLPSADVFYGTGPTEAKLA